MKLNDINAIDDHVDEEIFQYLNLNNPQSFFLFAGAGSGKTRSLVTALQRVRKEYGHLLRTKRQKIAIITYTNAACDEIKQRLDYSTLFSVSTIHSFVWELIKDYPADIKEWLRTDLVEEIASLNAQQLKSRGVTKTSIDRERKIESKTKRLQNLNNIKSFTYNPNGDNISKDSLNHTEVIAIGANFLMTRKLMQSIITQKFPILLIDESQDTKKELIDAFFEVQKNNNSRFVLGLFGDTMQRIYSDGKENLGRNLPPDWATPVKKMNHRCPMRVVTLINKIRSSVDAQIQQPRSDKEEGFVRFFIVPSLSTDKIKTEQVIEEKMALLTKDDCWTGVEKSIKILVLEHHMAAKRMGFFSLYEPLYKVKRFRTSILDGTLPGIRLFTQQVLPLISAKLSGDEFEVTRIVKRYSPLFRPEVFKISTSQQDIIKRANFNVNELFNLWKDGNDPKLLDVLNVLAKNGLFVIPNALLTIAMRNDKEQQLALKNSNNTDEDDEEIEDRDEQIDAWDLALQTPFSQIEKYNEYISDSAMFGTHQGVKGLQFERVAVILDDDDAGGFLFSYDKLFGAKSATDTDRKNVTEGRETTIDRTQRLFYVTCSRAEKSLAIIAYTANPSSVKNTVIENKWFSPDEIEIL
jgi:DNA helicase-2/ATP-dependent DNA helicase PcrA